MSLTNEERRRILGEKVSHTPGPWYFDAETQTVLVREWRRNQFMGDCRGCIIAGFEQSHGGQHRERSLGLRPEIEANGRLIAAAPAMLEVLEEILSELRNYSDEHDGHYAIDVILQNKAERIAKEARG